MKFTLTLFALCCSLVMNLSANMINATVVSIIDGNTIEIESAGNGKQKIVIAGIDSPELEQEFGMEAKNFLHKLILNKMVSVDVKGKDKWGNYLGVVFYNDDDVRVPLLKEGLAWTDEKRPDVNLEPYKVWAQRKGKGLWKDPDPTPPWKFRREQSMAQPKSS